MGEIVYALPPLATRALFGSGLRYAPFPRQTPPHFASTGRLSFGKDAAQSPYPGWQSPQRRKQPERYAKYHSNIFFGKYIKG
jgi:hypothetical protein